MAKNENMSVRVLQIFFRAIKLYVLNLPKFLRYMAFPVLGVLVGCAWNIGLSYWLSVGTQTPDGDYVFLFNSPLITFLIFLILLVPGFFILCKAFYDYIVAMVALNSAALDLVATDTLLKPVRAYNSIIEYREKQYFLLILILSIAYSVLGFPPLLIAFVIYSCLVLQAFAADDRFSAIDALVRGFKIVPGNVWNTALLLLLLYLFTYIIVPEVIYWLLDAGNMTKDLNAPVIALINNMPLNELFLVPINTIIQNFGSSFAITAEMVAGAVTKMTIISIVIGFTLPIRAIACTLWYKELDLRNSSGASAAKKLAKKAKEQEE